MSPKHVYMVSDEEWMEIRHSDYAKLHAAVTFLVGSPAGTKIKISAPDNDISAGKFKKTAHETARRRGIRLRSVLAGGWLFMATAGQRIIKNREF